MQWNDEELLQVFLSEAQETLATIEEGLLKLEQQPADAETLDNIFRAAHTLKGGAATLSLTTLRDAAHAAEDLLEAIRDGRASATGAAIGVLLHAVDLLRALLPAKLGDAPSLGEVQQTIFEELRRLAAGDAIVAPPAAEPIQQTSEAPPRRRSLRVSVDRLDRMLDLSAEIGVIRAWFPANLPLPETIIPAVLEQEEKLAQALAELQELIMSSRMVPLDALFRQYQRTVRDAAAASGKQVELVIEGAEIELDTRIVELIKDPLMHIVRNAVDHGIEAPWNRLYKRDVGMVRIRARREGPALLIEVSDDGRGFDRDRIVARGRQLGMISGNEPLSDHDVYALVFTPGFSTSEAVNGLSGRGVGMDVVQQNISALRGTVSIRSCSGAGSTISIRLPLTLAVVAALPVRVGEEVFALPLDSVVECLALPDRVHADVVHLRGESVPVLSLESALDLAPSGGARRDMVVIRHGRGKVAFLVDEIFESIQAVIKPLGKLFAAFPFIAGSTVLTSGRVALILDADGIVDSVQRRETAGTA